MSTRVPPSGYYAVYFKDPEGIKYQIVCCDQVGTAAESAGMRT